MGGRRYHCLIMFLAFLVGHPSIRAAPVRSFILAGQSNMEGHGQIKANPKSKNGGKGTLEHVVTKGADAKRLANFTLSREFPSAAVSPDNRLICPDLEVVIAAWPMLPEAVKAGIVAMVRATGGA